MSLTLSLNSALSGLRVNRESLAVLSNNIANANNEKYSRQIIEQSAVTMEGVGAGVQISDISRKIDSYLQEAIRAQGSMGGRADTLSDFADRMQILLGNPGSGNSINNYVTNVFNAMQSLAENPERSSSRLFVINSAQQFAEEMHNIVDGVQALRFDADQEIKTSTNTVNIQLRDLYNINNAIANARALNRPVSGLLDKRDAAIRELSTHVDVQVYTKPDDTVRVYAKGGAVLLDEYLYEIEYTPSPSIEGFTASGAHSNPIYVYRLDVRGNRDSGGATLLATGGTGDEVSTHMESGKIKALMDIRDDKLPQILEQLDMLAARVRDEVNVIHNAGSGYPGSKSLTGTRAIAAGDVFNWTGSVRIGLTDNLGKPVTSPYSDEESGMRPLTIDLSTLNSGLGDGAGYPNVQTIINEINHYYNRPLNRVTLGNLNNIQLSSITQKLPASYFDFDFDLENISGDDAKFFVTNTVVKDDAGLDITSVTNSIPTVALNSTNTFTTTAGSATVTIAATGHGLAEGEYIYLAQPTSTPGGLTSAALSGYFRVESTSADSFTIQVANLATANDVANEAGLKVLPEYATAPTGTNTRTGAGGTFRADLAGNLTSEYFDISVTVGSLDENDEITTSTITYRVTNNNYNLYNKRYGASAATVDGTVIVPLQTNAPYAQAKLVNADGRELKKVNGQYLADEQGYLKIESVYGSYYLNIDSLDSKQNGNPSASPFAIAGTERGFSHYFELNNFYNSNVPTATGDTVYGSASSLNVASRIARDPGQISTGRLLQSLAPADSSKPPYYTYERISGDNSLIQRMADLANRLVVFDSAGGLNASTQTLNGYAGEILGFAGADANSAESNARNAQIILDGFIERSSAISGVNLDEELANTIIYQNAYSASARIISVTDELYKDLINAFS